MSDTSVPFAETETDLTAAQRALDAFLVDNQELEQLTARLSAFNLFNVLRIADAEIRHSHVLAWLLTPGESHGLGPTFLRRFLSRLLMENDGGVFSLSPAQIELMNFSDVGVLREWQSIDILAHSKAGGWCLLIENKIHSGEGKGQLVRYLGRVKRDFPDRQIVPVYLTLEGDDPSDEADHAEQRLRRPRSRPEPVQLLFRPARLAGPGAGGHCGLHAACRCTGQTVLSPPHQNSWVNSDSATPIERAQYNTETN